MKTKNKEEYVMISLWVSLFLFIVHILQMFFPSLTEEGVLNKRAYIEVYRFITSLFLHANFSHLLQNVIALIIFGLLFEAVVGWKNFLKVFFLSGVVGNIVILLYTPNVEGLGSSGAIMGIIGALAYLEPWMPVYYFAPLPVISLAILYFIIDFIGLLHPTDNIGYIAHIGGFITGILWAYAYKKKHTTKKEEEEEDIDDEEAYAIIKNNHELFNLL